MAMHKYLDWRGWLRGLYLNWIKSLTTTLISFGGTNAVDYLGMKGVGINLEQAASLLVSITLWEVVRYLNQKPEPEEKTEETNL